MNPQTDQVARLIVEAKGQQGVDDLKNAIDANKTSINALGVAYANNVINLAEYNKRAASLAGEQEQLNETLKVAEQHLKRLQAGLVGAGQSATEAKSKMNGLNTAIRNTGFGINDFFSNNGPLGQKLMGFSNNVGNIVTGVAQSMGKLGPAAFLIGQGLEGAFTGIGATLTGLGIKSVDDLVNYFKGGVTKAEGSLSVLEGRIKELTGKKHLVPIEILELANARKEVERIEASLSAVEKLSRTQAKYEEKSGKAVSSVIAESADDQGNHLGAEQVTAMLRAQVVGELLKPLEATAANEQSPIQKRIKELEDELSQQNDESMDPATMKELAEERSKLAESRKRAADMRTAITTGSPDGETPALADVKLGDILKPAQEGQGENQAAAQAALRKRLRRLGLTKTAEQVREASPAALKGADEKKDADKEQAKVDKLVEELKDVLHEGGLSDSSVKGVLAKQEGKKSDDLAKVVHDVRDQYKDLKKEAAGKEALVDLRAQLTTNETPAAEAAKVMADFQGKRADLIKKEIERLKEEFARRQALVKLTAELREAGKSDAQIDDAKAALGPGAPPRLITAKAQEQARENDRVKALKQNKEVGGQAAPDAPKEVIERETVQAKEARERQAALQEVDKQAREVGVPLDPELVHKPVTEIKDTTKKLKEVEEQARPAAQAAVHEFGERGEIDMRGALQRNLGAQQMGAPTPRNAKEQADMEASGTPFQLPANEALRQAQAQFREQLVQMGTPAVAATMAARQVGTRAGATFDKDVVDPILLGPGPQKGRGRQRPQPRALPRQRRVPRGVPQAAQQQQIVPVVNPLIPAPPQFNPAANQPLPRPQFNQPVIIPRVVNPVVRPRVEPAVSQAVINPIVNPAVVIPRVVNPVVRPRVEPAVSQPIINPQVGPAVVTPQVGPAVVTPQVGPAVVRPQVGPAVVTPQVGPAVVRPQVGPAVVTPKVNQPVVNPQVNPAVVKPVVHQPVINRPAAPPPAPAPREPKKGPKVKRKLVSNTQQANRLEKAYKKPLGTAYEARVATNQAAIKGGVPVAKTPAEEAALAKEGKPFALPEATLKSRLQSRMQADFQARGASPEGATTAVQHITSSADKDLAERTVKASQGGLQANQAALAVAKNLSAEVQRQKQVSDNLIREWQRLNAETSPDSRGYLNRGSR